MKFSNCHFETSFWQLSPTFIIFFCIFSCSFWSCTSFKGSLDKRHELWIRISHPTLEAGISEFDIENKRCATFLASEDTKKNVLLLTVESNLFWTLIRKMTHFFSTVTRHPIWLYLSKIIKANFGTFLKTQNLPKSLISKSKPNWLLFV